MSNARLSPVESEVWTTIRRLNAAWVSGHVDEMEELLHASMVVVPPGGGEPVRGREACLASYRDFVTQAKVVRFEELTRDVEVFWETSVVRYTFEITYGIEDRWTTEQGSEVFVLTREDGEWVAVWRMQLAG